MNMRSPPVMPPRRSLNLFRGSRLETLRRSTLATCPPNLISAAMSQSAEPTGASGVGSVQAYSTKRTKRRTLRDTLASKLIPFPQVELIGPPVPAGALAMRPRQQKVGGGEIGGEITPSETRLLERAEEPFEPAFLHPERC